METAGNGNPIDLRRHPSDRKLHNPRQMDTDAFQLLGSPYHPDTLRHRPRGPQPQQAIGFATLRAAPHITAVTCWSNLQPAPNAMLRRGRRCPVPVSVIVDTDDTVISFLAPSPTEMLDTVLSDTADGGLLDVAEATAYLAGTRSAYVSVVLPIEVEEQVWAPRVRRRADRVVRLLSSSTRHPENVRGIGTTTWHALHELLSEIAQSRFIAKSEQRCAMTTVEWMNARLADEMSRKRLA